MAVRPVFFAAPDHPGFVERRQVEFSWFPGFSVAQKQRSIASLHESAGAGPLLEISSKSTEPLGVKLSAFNLRFETPAGPIPLECAFQGSKVFERGGPFEDLYDATPRDAKRDERLVSSGKLVAFELHGERFPLEPKTFFYDWIYARAVDAQADLRAGIRAFAGFTDIEFNPQRSVNCQAQSAARYAGLALAGKLEPALSSPERFAEIVWGASPSQQQLFDD